MVKKQNKGIIEPLVVSVVVFVVVSLLVQYLVYQESLIAKENERGKLQQELIRVKDGIKGILYSDITVANALAVIHKNYSGSYNFDSAAKQLIEANKYAEALQITNGGIITHVYPHEGYDKTVGINTLADSARKKEADTAVKRNDIFFAGPRKLRLGGVGILGKVPIISNGGLMGFCVVLTKLPTIVAALNLDDSSNRIYSYKLVKNHSVDSNGYYFTKMLPGNGNPSVSTEIPEGNWTLTVSYSTIVSKSNFPVVQSLLGFLLALFAGIFTYRRIRQPYYLKEIIDEKTKELSAREKYYRTITEANYDATVLLDETGKVSYQTPSVEKILGYSLAEIQQIDGIELIHPDERDRDSAAFAALMQEHGKITHLTHRIKNKKGNYIWIESTYRNLLHDENIRAVVLNYHDITDKVNAQHQLGERVKELTTIYYVNEVLKDIHQTSGEVFRKIVEVLPPGWQYPEVCAARITFEGQEFHTANYRPSAFVQAEHFTLEDGRQGLLEVIYTGEMPFEFEGPFLKEERDLIRTLTETIVVYFNKASQQRELAKSEANFRSSFEHAAIGMALVSPDGTFMKVNNALCNMLGYSEVELLSVPFRHITHPEHVDADMENVTQILNGSKDFYRTEKRYLHKNGGVIWVNLNSAIIRDSDARPMYFVSQIENITEKKEVYNELEKSEANMRSIFDNSEILYLLLDPDYNVIALNLYMQDIYYQVTGNKLHPGVNLSELLLPERREKALEVYNKVKNGKQPITYETKYVLQDHTKYFLANVVPILAHNSVIGLCISSIDITKLKQLELEKEKFIADLISRNRDLQEFAQIVSHNVRGPLSTLMGLTDMLKHGAAEDERDFIMEGIEISSRRLDAVVIELNNILEVKKESSETRETVRLDVIWEEVRHKFSDLIAASNAAIDVDFTACNELFTMRSYIYNMLYNLVSNSLKYRDKKRPPQIRIWTEHRPGEMLFGVKDNGIGIDMNMHRDQLFLLNRRFHNTSDGKGLGLYIVKAQVDILHGTIEIDSEPGVGTTVKVRLPV